jgi:hypothetical protein
MGYGSYDADAHKALTTSRAALPKEEVFKQTDCHPDMNPYGLTFRESRDSAAHPDSIGIIFALDETGSMGDIPFDLAKKTLPHFMEVIIEGGFVKDPQLLLMGIGDVYNHEKSPVQVGQFESEAHLMDKWLTTIHLEHNGGGNGGESYDFAFYVAARHTKMDCWEKRGRKGYLFVTGDEPHFGRVSSGQVRAVIGTDLKADISMRDIVEEASSTFHCFFLVPDLGRRQGCESSWRPVLGDRVICMESPEDTCEVAAVLIGLTEGTLEDLEAVNAKLLSLGRKSGQINRIMRAIEPYAAAIGRGGAVREAEPVGKAKRTTKR